MAEKSSFPVSRIGKKNGGMDGMSYFLAFCSQGFRCEQATFVQLTWQVFIINFKLCYLWIY